MKQRTLNAIVDLVEPFLRGSASNRDDFVNALFVGIASRPDIDFSGGSREVAQRVVIRLWEYGEIAPGEFAIERLLESIYGQVGIEKQRTIRALQRQLKQPESPTPKRTLRQTAVVMESVSVRTKPPQKSPPFGLATIIGVLVVLALIVVGWVSFGGTSSQPVTQSDTSLQVTAPPVLPTAVPQVVSATIPAAAVVVVEDDTPNPELEVAWANTALTAGASLPTNVEVVEQSSSDLRVMVTAAASANTTTDWRISSKRNALDDAALYLRLAGLFLDDNELGDAFVHGSLDAVRYDEGEQSVTLVIRMNPPGEGRNE